MRKFGLIGYPLSHSFSPAYFANKFSREKIPECSYEAYPIENIKALPQLLKDVPELEGLNVTIPYKKQVIPYLNESTGAVKKMAACNCITIKNQTLKGYNTDVTGFEISLRPYLLSHHKKALILGTGGAAAAVEYVFENLGIEYLSVSRQVATGSTNLSYPQVTKDIIQEYTLIINTTPLGMYPHLDECPDIPYQYLSPKHYLFDLIYNPEKTLFLQRGEERGAVVKNGSDMLTIQAEESWRIWND